MNKVQFLRSLRELLAQLPEAEINKHTQYYSEIIEDMMEDGLTEQDAIASIGDINEIAASILMDYPIKTLVKTRSTPKGGWTAAAIVFAIIGSPIWIPILIAILSVILAIYIVIWAVVISLFACVIAIAATLAAAIVVGAKLLIVTPAVGLLMIGTGLTGLAINVFLFWLVIAAAKGCVKLTAAVGRGIKSALIRKPC